MPGERPRRRRRRRDPRPAGELTRRYRPAGAGAAGGAMQALTAVWARVVGDVAARHSAPVRRSRGGMVAVACSDAAWAQELTFRRDELLERLLAEAPACGATGLRFSVADHVPGAAPAPPPPRPAPPRPGPEHRAAGARAADGIDDERIRSLIAGLAAGAAARSRRE